MTHNSLSESCFWLLYKWLIYVDDFPVLWVSWGFSWHVKWGDKNMNSFPKIGKNHKQTWNVGEFWELKWNLWTEKSLK